ncbi:hypothetical protein [Hyalangium versicolor]|uniref:hypothetical protein n=1 Tax=Hyalangium versicolor TaxID=2861190 RepID=UPI001CCAD9E4|nr:hypothetical protein [Hyalangium versicolor]
MSTKRNAQLLWATPLAALQLACGGGTLENSGPEGTSTAHAIVTCQSTTMYANYSPSAGSKDPIKTLSYGDKLSFREDVGYPSWAVTLGEGLDNWGYLLRSCYTRCFGVNNPIPGCF